MNFDLDDNQRAFVDTVERFLGPIDVAGRRRQRAGPGRYPRERWTRLAELGLLALAAPEALGGLAGSRVDLALVAEALGKGLAIDPWLENGVLPVRLAAAAGDAELVGQLTSGEECTALAFAEPGRRYALDATVRADEAGRLTGDKTFVLGGGSANLLLVTAQGSEGRDLYLLDPAADGVHRRPYTVTDGSEAVELRLYAAPARALGLPPGAFTEAVGDARLLAAAEMLGLATRLFDDTLAYLKQREQFGVAIGSFQALQHRLVDCYAELELARSLVLRTALEPAGDWPATAAGTKAQVGATAMHVAAEAVQMHGGMGQTDELAIGHGLKRIMLLDKLFGDESEGLLAYARAA